MIELIAPLILALLILVIFYVFDLKLSIENDKVDDDDDDDETETPSGETEIPSGETETTSASSASDSTQHSHTDYAAGIHSHDEYATTNDNDSTNNALENLIFNFQRRSYERVNISDASNGDYCVQKSSSSFDCSGIDGTYGAQDCLYLGVNECNGLSTCSAFYVNDASSNVQLCEGNLWGYDSNAANTDTPWGGEDINDSRTSDSVLDTALDDASGQTFDNTGFTYSYISNYSVI